MSDFQISGPLAGVAIACTVLVAIFAGSVAVTAFTGRHRHTFELLAHRTWKRFTIDNRTTSHQVFQLHGCACGKVRKVLAPAPISTTLDPHTANARALLALFGTRRRKSAHQTVTAFLGDELVTHLTVFEEGSQASCGAQVRDDRGGFQGFCQEPLVHEGEHVPGPIREEVSM